MNISVVSAIIIRHLFTWKRNLNRLVETFWWSALDLIFWGLTSNYLMQQKIWGANIVTFFLGGIILWTIVQNSQREINMPLLDEAWNRNLINIFTTPLRLSEFIFATIFLGVIKIFLTLIFLIILAIFLYQYNIFHYGLVLIPIIANLLLVGWWTGFFIDGLILRYGFKVESFAWALVFVIHPFSAILYPVSILPLWARIISYMLPTSYIFENMRSMVFNGTYSANYLLISFLLNIFYTVLSIIFLKYMFADALKNAKLVKLN